MSRARILANYVSSGDELALKAPLASPAFTGTPSITLGSDGRGEGYYRAAGGALTRLATGADGTVLTSTGAGAVPAFEAIPVAGIYLSGMTVITTGTTTYTKPLNVTALHVTATGGGGGGASGWDSWNHGGGGGAGATLITFLTGLPTASTDYTCAVGTGGEGGGASDSGNDGVAGVTTTLDIQSISCPGGHGGTTGGVTGEVPAGGTPTGGQSGNTVLLTGESGGSRGGGTVADQSAPSNHGGGSFWGGRGPANKNEAGQAGKAYGSGGGGGQNENAINRAGGDGHAGVIVIYEYTNP